MPKRGDIIKPYRLGRGSLRRLAGKHPEVAHVVPVHPDLVAVVKLALRYSIHDFTVLSSTVRDKRMQREFVRLGKSRTMKSLHLPQASGFIHAVDLGVWIGNAVVWTPDDLYFDLARAMQRAAIELNVPVEWGACWCSLLTAQSPEMLNAEYARLCRVKYEAGRRRSPRPFIDLVHFQLPRNYR